MADFTINLYDSEMNLVDTGIVTESTPLVFDNLPYGDYTIEEESTEGYTLISIVNDSVTIDADNLDVQVEVTNKLENGGYGALYNWDAASKNGGAGVGSIAPTGCHVPSYSEWETLSTYLGGGTVAGGKLKEDGLTHWDSPNYGATNESGFTAFGSGERQDDGTFYSLKILSIFWHYDEIFSDAGVYWLNTVDEFLEWQGSLKVNGNSIRCIVDDPDYVGDITDIDGNIYPTIKIGTQLWLLKNLAVTKFNDNTPIPNVTDPTAWIELITPGYCWFDNDINNKV